MSPLKPRLAGGIVGIAWLTGWCGCGPTTLLEPPRELPERLAGRALWHTPRGYIYATDKIVAGETDRWLGALAGHIQRTFGAELEKGLIIVIDRDEMPVVDSIDELVRLETVGAGLKREEKRPTASQRREQLEESGMSELLACRITPVALDDQALHSAGLSPQSLPSDLAWRMSCPSHRAMEAAIWEFGPRAIEKRKGRVFAVMTAWAYPLAFPEAAKALRLARDVLAFGLWCGRREWSSDRQQREIDRYTRERAFVLSPVLSMALELAKSTPSTKDESNVQSQDGSVQEKSTE